MSASSSTRPPTAKATSPWRARSTTSVLVDFNSNGRFDDETTIRSDSPHGRRAGLSRIRRRALLIDPDLSRPGLGSPYEWTSDDSRLPVAKVVCIDGRYYDMKISPAGDKLTLTPSSVADGQRDQPQRRLPRDGLRRQRVLEDQRQQGHSGARARGRVEAAELHDRRDGARGSQSARRKRRRARRRRRRSRRCSTPSHNRWKPCSVPSPPRTRDRAPLYDRRGPGNRQVQGGQGPRGRDGGDALRPALHADRDGRFLPGRPGGQAALPRACRWWARPARYAPTSWSTAASPKNPPSPSPIRTTRWSKAATSSMDEASPAGTRGEYHPKPAKEYHVRVKMTAGPFRDQPGKR